ncbi:hypothetical protein [Sneathia sanguinegens]
MKQLEEEISYLKAEDEKIYEISRYLYYYINKKYIDIIYKIKD